MKDFSKSKELMKLNMWLKSAQQPQNKNKPGPFLRHGSISELQNETDLNMDAAFMPQEVVIQHIVTHNLKLELGSSITNLGQPIRNILIACAALYLSGRIISSVQAVLNKSK